ncbi:hypothetical protein ACR42D_05115 [Desulfovibrio caledoniensis]
MSQPNLVRKTFPHYLSGISSGYIKCPLVRHIPPEYSAIGWNGLSLCKDFFRIRRCTISINLFIMQILGWIASLNNNILNAHRMHECLIKIKGSPIMLSPLYEYNTCLSDIIHRMRVITDRIVQLGWLIAYEGDKDIKFIDSIGYLIKQKNGKYDILNGYMDIKNNYNLFYILSALDDAFKHHMAVCECNNKIGEDEVVLNGYIVKNKELVNTELEEIEIEDHAHSLREVVLGFDRFLGERLFEIKE